MARIDKSPPLFWFRAGMVSLCCLLLSGTGQQPSATPLVSFREASMNEYRVYHMDEDGHIDGPADGIVCESDEVAIVRAKHLLDGHDVELWQCDRLVIRMRAREK
jgi:hypothetical protein